jgi:hypothetical protein
VKCSICRPTLEKQPAKIRRNSAGDPVDFRHRRESAGSSAEFRRIYEGNLLAEFRRISVVNMDEFRLQFGGYPSKSWQEFRRKSTVLPTDFRSFFDGFSKKKILKFQA